MQTYNNSVVLKFDDGTTGNADSGAPVTVRIASSGALATIYDNQDIQILNPLTTTVDGNYSFKAAYGKYDIIVRENQVNELVIPNVSIGESYTTYETLADMVGSSISTSQVVSTQGCLTNDDKGGGLYRIYTPADYATDYPGQSVSIYGGALTIANGNIAVLQPVNNIINYSQFSVDITGVAVADTMLVACHQFADDNK
ncbi:MAG: hypothetical protein IZT57_03130, partial [Chloroflexi bacterium]|nr:hypothetical protein [Chloroflexota bacterium]